MDRGSAQRDREENLNETESVEVLGRVEVVVECFVREWWWEKLG